MSYRIRRYRPGDRAAVASLMKRLWLNNASLNQRYLSWRYDSNPYPEGLMAVAECDGEIVAVRGAHGMRWRVGGGTIPMPCLGDTVVGRAHEGRGLVQKLTRWLFRALSERGVEWVVNQSPGPLVEKVSLRADWRKVGEWTVAQLVRKDPEAAIAFDRFDRLAEPVEQDGVRLVPGPMPPAELAELATRTFRGHIGHARDEAYFRWRFANPFAEYRWLEARTDRLEGYLVLGSMVSRRQRVRVLDLQGTDGWIQSVLLSQALDWGAFRETRIWWNRFPRPVLEVMVERGFNVVGDDAGRKSTILVAPTRRGVQSFEANGVDLLTLANWDPRMIHSDAT